MKPKIQLVTLPGIVNLSHVKIRAPREGPCIRDYVGVLLLQEISDVKKPVL